MSDWRPFEPSSDEAERIKREAKDNTCNMHSDCAAADEAFKREHPEGLLRVTPYGDRWIQRSATHCHDDDCEECFGC